MLENDLESVGMPFWPKRVNYKDEMYMTFSKQQINSYLSTGRVRSENLKDVFFANVRDKGYICIVFSAFFRFIHH